MTNFCHLKWVLIGACTIGLIGCGFNQGMQAKRTSLTVDQFSSLYGDLPATKSGSQVVGIQLLSNGDGSSVYGSANQKTQLFDGVRDHDVNTGEELRLIAEIETRNGSRIYLAQKDLGIELLDGYVNRQAVSEEQGASDDGAGDGDGAPPIREDQPIPEVEEPEAPVAGPPSGGAGTCPDIGFSFQSENGTDIRMHTDSLMGHNFRDPKGFDGGYDWTYNLHLKSGLQADYAKINIENKTTGQALPEAKVGLDGTYGEQVIPFPDFLEPNDWYADKVRFNIDFMDGNREDSTPDATLAECGIDTELSSPIVLDFSGDSFLKTTHLFESTTHFDVNADGSHEQTGWISNNSALLALDRNHNGKIDDGSELFGNFTPLFTGANASNGYEALKDLMVFQPIQSGEIDSSNLVYDQLIVWKDTDSDGQAQFYEKQYLDQAGIERISVEYKELSAGKNQIPFSNQVRFQSSFYGSQCPETGCSSYDVWFATVNPVQRQVSN